MKFWRYYFKEYWIEPAKNPWHWVLVFVVGTILYMAGHFSYHK